MYVVQNEDDLIQTTCLALERAFDLALAAVGWNGIGDYDSEENHRERWVQVWFNGLASGKYYY